LLLPFAQHFGSVPSVRVVHVSVPAAHIVVHEPQWFSSVSRSKHCGPWPVVQTVVFVPQHVPLSHVSPELHAFVHEPQCISSSAQSTHVPPQLCCPAGQHFDDDPSVEQVSVPLHVTPQAPQLALSVVGLTHVSPHLICGDVHIRASGGASTAASLPPPSDPASSRS
jgi:hypothetical protein